MYYNDVVKEWDSKLKASGFKDIEDRLTGELQGSKHNISLDAFYASNPSKADLYLLEHQEADCLTYYRDLEHWGNDNRRWFKVGDKTIWMLHADGHSVREIAQKVSKSKSAVHRRLKAIRHQFAASPVKP